MKKAKGKGRKAKTEHQIRPLAFRPLPFAFLESYS
ncbi:hypothetical protein B0F88_10539 [Methylobacter tundripaludum]|uniref:Uncharacterized protein n=1 Tax=Methylobacter tundripaludum TaxID=173365 RepID=A0A2S6H3B7_9GAMM|nr:hypothetical protein B0F88_10539 [Methylobacter tundripaludum]